MHLPTSGKHFGPLPSRWRRRWGLTGLIKIQQVFKCLLSLVPLIPYCVYHPPQSVVRVIRQNKIIFYVPQCHFATLFGCINAFSWFMYVYAGIAFTMGNFTTSGLCWCLPSVLHESPLSANAYWKKLFHSSVRSYSVLKSSVKTQQRDVRTQMKKLKHVEKGADRQTD